MSRVATAGRGRPMNQGDFRARLAEIIEDVGGGAELARLSGLSPRQISRYINGTGSPPKISTMARLASAAGVRLEWLRAGAVPKSELPEVREADSQYHVVNLETLSVVVAAVEKEIPDSTPEARAGLIALAYAHMTARAAMDEKDLADFFRHWRQSRDVPPKVPDFHSPEVAGTRRKKAEEK